MVKLKKPVLLPVSTNDILPPLAYIQNDCSVSFFIPLILSFWVVCCQPCGWGVHGGFGELHLQTPKLGIFTIPLLLPSVPTRVLALLRNVWLVTIRLDSFTPRVQCRVAPCVIILGIAIQHLRHSHDL